MSLNPLRVLIIGCGNIAGAFDQGRLTSDSPLTHAGAYSRDNRFSVAACVEPDAKRRSSFMHTWEVPKGFCSIEEALEYGVPCDVISICSPTHCHAHDIEMALRLRPKLIFCEKPVTHSIEETERLVTKCEDLNIPMAVNYTRRWDPDISRLRSEMLAGRWGKLRSVVGYYNKGLLNNGSHMLDLLHLLIGSMDVVKVGDPIYDFFPYDPTVPAWLEGPKGVPIHLACGHAEDYAIFELQLLFSQGLVVMEEGGMFWRERCVIDSEIFKGYRKLDEGVRRPGGYSLAMQRAIDNIYLTISQGAALASTGESALAAQRTCEAIRPKSIDS